MVVMVPMIMVSPAIPAIRLDDAAGGGEKSDGGHYIQDEFHEFDKIPVLLDSLFVCSFWGRHPADPAKIKVPRVERRYQWGREPNTNGL
jgi:hypothetical protein